jgi:hypothetical protein
MTHFSRTFTTGLLVLAATTAAGAVAQTMLNVRTGEWQVTTTASEIPEGLLAQMPEATRGPWLAEMKKPHTDTSCITEQDLQKLNFGNLANENGNGSDCKVTSRSVTRTSADITEECNNDNIKSMTMHLDASSPTSISATIKTTTAGGPMTMQMSGKWLSATCKDK